MCTYIPLLEKPTIIYLYLGKKIAMRRIFMLYDIHANHNFVIICVIIIYIVNRG